MKKIVCYLPICLGLVLIFSDQIHAQGLTAEDIKAQMVKEWTRSKAYTVEYLNTMPADKYTFKADDSIRSFAQQMLHIAQANLFLMWNATDKQMLPWIASDPEHRASAHVKDSVMYYVTTSYDFAIEALKGLDASKWAEKKKIFGFEETRFALLNKSLEHQAHHRGQTTIYIRLQKIKPPQEKLF